MCISSLWPRSAKRRSLSYMQFCNFLMAGAFSCAFDGYTYYIFQFFKPLIHFSHHIFSKKCFSLGWGAHFCKTISNTFDQKYNFFHPQTALKRAMFVIFACSCRSVARPLRYLFASCLLQKQPVARLPCSFRLQAPSAKTIVCIALAILAISCAICCLLCAFTALHTPFL